MKKKRPPTSKCINELFFLWYDSQIVMVIQSQAIEMNSTTATRKRFHIATKLKWVTFILSMWYTIFEYEFLILILMN